MHGKSPRHACYSRRPQGLTIVTRTKMHPRLFVGCVLVLSGAGAWVSGELVKEHAGRWSSGQAPTGLFERVCKATHGTGFNCATTVRGPWGMIKIPIPVPSRASVIGVHTVFMPVAFLGLGYFVFMGVWFAFIGRPRLFGYRWHGLPLGVGLCGLAVSLFYVGLMATGSAPWCVWCLAIHGINFLIVLTIWRLGAGRRLPELAPDVAGLGLEPEKIARAMTTFREATTAVAFSLVLISGLWAYRREHLVFRNELRSLLPYKAVVTSLQENPAFLLREFHAQPQQDIPLRSGEQSDSTQPQLAVFTDFECPACYCNSLTIRNKNTEAFKGKLTVMVRHYPLDNECNANVKTELHPNACEAAYAAEAARLQGGDGAFRKMYALLFENRKMLGNKLYRKLAGQIGLDTDRFQADMEGDVVRRIVQSDINLAEELSVTGTPTMLLNGRRIPKLCQVPVFWEAFAEEWNRSAQHRLGADNGNRNVLAATHAIANRRE